jgi:hypothetical protein
MGVDSSTSRGRPGTSVIINNTQTVIWMAPRLAPALRRHPRILRVHLLPCPLEPLRQRRRALRPLLHRSSRSRIADLRSVLRLAVRERAARAGGGLEFVVGELRGHGGGFCRPCCDASMQYRRAFGTGWGLRRSPCADGGKRPGAVLQLREIAAVKQTFRGTETQSGCQPSGHPRPFEVHRGILDMVEGSGAS